MGTSSKSLKILDKTVSYLSFIGAIGIVLIMLLIVADVIGRSVFNQPVTGTSEIVRNSIVGITFLQMAHVLKNGRHIRTTVILDRVSYKWRLVLNGLASLLGMALFILIISQSWEAALDSYVTGEYEGEGALEVPTFPTRFLILLGSLAIILQFLANLLNSIFTLLRGKDAEDEAQEDKISM